MTSRLDDRAWELVGAMAAIEPPMVPEVAMRILFEVRARAMALLAARDGNLVVARATPVSCFEISPAVAHVEPAEGLDWDVPPDMPIPRD